MAQTATIAPTTLGLTPSFGFGDRIGLAGPGHLLALQQDGGAVRGIFAQQSIREMARTRRTPDQVMAAATAALSAAEYDLPWGADADHLKSEQDVDYTADAGFVFFTIDPSEHVDQKADNYAADRVEAEFNKVKDQAGWVEQYAGKTVLVKDGPKISFEPLAVKRAAVKYGRAIAHALKLAAYIKQAAAKRNQPYELEISVDETDQPTTLAEHYIIADQLRRGGVQVVSLAPRFIGELEKGVDYKGDLAKLEQSLKDHAAIAAELGPYKLSLHSGSDKLSMYRLFGRATKGRFHVKTAGTSYLEAVRVVCRHDEKLFREIIDFSRGRYDTDKATYHVSATVAGVAAPAQITSVKELEQVYLETWDTVARGKGFTNPGRQILHCTFGSVLTHDQFGPAIRDVLKTHPDTHEQILAEHFGRHLRELNQGANEAK